MKKIVLTTAAVAATLLSTTVLANDAAMEKCEVNGLSVEVPAGECAKVQKGDFSGVSEEVKAEVEKAAAPEAK